MTSSLKNLLKQKGLTQVNVAEKAQVSRSTVQKMCDGDLRHSFENIYSVADALGQNRIVFMAKYFPRKLSENEKLLKQFREMIIYSEGEVLPIHLYKEVWDLYKDGIVE